MNQTLECILSRRSVKKYADRQVPISLVEEIVKAGTYAPSGMNKQSAIILAVTNKELRDRLSRINSEIIMGRKQLDGETVSDPFYGAPVVLVVLAKKEIPTHLYDGSLVMENMMIAAQSLGLASCWIHRAKETFETEEGKQILASLGISDDYEGIGNCILGYADSNAVKPQAPRKKDYVVWVK
ncbi:MAG: nitroreductase [Bacteroidales bacterium]|nr:nitroreductase [Candidatus Colimorpha onthohippi]